jgi:hypothetical protein
MKFAARVYLIAGIIGLIEIVPLYVTESLIGRMYPPAITHPEFYYGFAGVTLAWQVLFLLLARDPLRYRPLMPATMLEKASFVIAALVLAAQQRMAPAMLGAVGIDAILGLLFLIAYIRTAPARTTTEPSQGSRSVAS